MAAAYQKEDFAPVRLRARFVHWLKVEAAKRGISMYRMVEEVAASGQRGRRPWDDEPATVPKGR